MNTLLLAIGLICLAFALIFILWSVIYHLNIKQEPYIWKRELLAEARNTWAMRSILLCIPPSCILLIIYVI